MEENEPACKKKWDPNLNDYTEVVPEFGSKEYVRKFGPLTTEQYTAYTAHMCD